MESKPDVKIVRPDSDVYSDKSFHDLALSPGKACRHIPALAAHAQGMWKVAISRAM